MVRQCKTNRWFPKKKSFSSLVLAYQVVSGKQLADKIKDTFISVTREIPPLSPTLSSDYQSESHYSVIPTEFIIKEEDVYSRLSYVSSSKAAAHVLALPVTSIFNASLQQAFVPKIWKMLMPYPSLKIRYQVMSTKILVPSHLPPPCQKTCERFVADWLLHLIDEKIDKRSTICIS